MPKAATKSQPPEAPLEPSLVERIQQLMAETEAIVEAEVQRRKALPEGATIPIDWIRMNLRIQSGGGCHCRCALKILEGK